MRKYFITFFLLVILSTIFVLVLGCKGPKNSNFPLEDNFETEQPQEKEDVVYFTNFVEGYEANNQDALTTMLHNEYTLQELHAFFGEIPFNETMMYTGINDALTIQEVAERFPIECVRHGGQIFYYSVYKVTEGGYFYVFWGFTATDYQAILNGGNAVTAKVRFTTYIASLKNEGAFQQIIPQQSTATDVAEIDPAMELTFAMSSPSSFHLLDNGNVLIIKYQPSGSISGRSSLTVKEVQAVSKGAAQTSSYLASILPQDLPD